MLWEGSHDPEGGRKAVPLGPGICVEREIRGDGKAVNTVPWFPLSRCQLRERDVGWLGKEEL